MTYATLRTFWIGQNTLIILYDNLFIRLVRCLCGVAILAKCCDLGLDVRMMMSLISVLYNISTR